MGNDDISNTGENKHHYLRQWEEQGFDVSLIENKSASEFSSLQQILQSALELKRRLVPFQHKSEVSTMLQELRNPLKLDEVGGQFDRWVKSRAPWEPGYYRSYFEWTQDEEHLIQYWEIIEICANLDESSWTSLDLLLPLLSNPENNDQIRSELNLLQADELRQRDLLGKAITQLNERGYEVEIKSNTLIDQFNEIEKIQEYSNQINLLELEIQGSILPFDPVLSDTFTQRLNEFVSSPSDEIKTLQKNVRTIAEHLRSRLEEMNTVLRQWQSEGFTYQNRLQIHPEDLLEWEQTLPEIEQQYHRHSGAFERWKEITQLWGNHDETIEEIAGKIEHTDAFLDKIEQLEQQWTEKELQGASLIERWEHFGFEMDHWRYKITQDPKQGLAELNLQLPLYDRANAVLESMLQIDTSLGGEDEVDRRSVILRTMDLDNDILDEMEQWAHKQTLRNTRHRRMLQSEWEQITRDGKADSNQTFTDLHAFEAAIASVELQSQNSTLGSVRSHALIRAKAELLRIEARGWTITELLQLHEDNPDVFFHQFSKAIDAITRIQTIQRRIAALDWRRDTQRAAEISVRVRNPLDLVKIEQQIPALIRHLSDRPIEDDGFSYTVWLPEQRPTLLPREQPIIRKEPEIIQPESALEEAHEAMLEAMEEPDQDEEAYEDTPVTIEPKPLENEIKPSDQDPASVKESEPVTDVKASETAVSKPILQSYETLLRQLGLTSEADVLIGSGDLSMIRRSLASFVGVEPRDMRVDRMLRLVLRLLPQNDLNDQVRIQLITLICDALPKYKQWVRMRLEARYMGASGDFFDDASRLGVALDRTPGPGVRVPLQADELTLPEISNLTELEKQTKRLIQTMNLPSAGGVN